MYKEIALSLASFSFLSLSFSARPFLLLLLFLLLFFFFFPPGELLSDLHGQGISTKRAFCDTASNFLNNQDSDRLSRRSRMQAASKDPPRELLSDLQGQRISTKRMFLITFLKSLKLEIVEMCRIRAAKKKGPWSGKKCKS